MDYLKESQESLSSSLPCADEDCLNYLSIKSGGAWRSPGLSLSPEVCVPSSVMGATLSKCLWHPRASQVNVYDHTIELTHVLEDSQEKDPKHRSRIS